MRLALFFASDAFEVANSSCTCKRVSADDAFCGKNVINEYFLSVGY